MKKTENNGYRRRVGSLKTVKLALRSWLVTTLDCSFAVNIAVELVVHKNVILVIFVFSELVIFSYDVFVYK